MEIEKLDIDSIFVKYTINEIRDIDEKIKVDMERKKEELRSMVGERYRDLIEAADAIFEMKTCAKGVEQFVHLLNDKCSKIDHTLLTQSTSSNTITDKQLPRLTFVVSIKILTETRRRCWMSLEANNFAAAARQYLLAQHMASSLSSSTNDEQLDSDSQKSIVAATRLWHQTRQMKATILDKCQLYLKNTDTDDRERMEQWSTVCNRLLNGNNKHIRLWDDLIKVELRARAKQVLHVRFDQFNQTAIQKIEQCLKAFHNSTTKIDKSSLEFNVLNYIWSDVDNNTPSDYVWTPSTHRNPVGDAKFSLKAVAISMDLQSLCRELDDELRQILDDVNEFSVADVSSMSSISDTSLSTTNNSSNSSIYSDSGFVEEHLEECVIQFCTTLLARLRQIANENEKIGNEEQTLSSLIWLGSCSRAIPIACKNLKNSLELVTNVADSVTSPMADRQWIIHICAKIDMVLRNKLSTFLDEIPTLVWDEIEIEESLDTDKTYKSVIRVPMYCTPFIEELLFYSCQEINQALAHGLDKELSSEMAYRILQTFLNVYGSWWSTEGQQRASKKRIQTRIIQIVYDLRFVHMLLERKDNSINTKDINDRFFKLVENIESEIDPFDLNVLSPYMQSHLQKIVPRSSLLFGHLITNDRLVPSKPLTMNSQDTNNILSLSSCTQRFSLLPIATNLSSISSGQKPLSKGNILKSNITHDQEHHTIHSIGSDANLASVRPLTSNVAEVATYYSKWFQNIVK
ncbi:unnamed protein product [Rotaria magnacalcarata]|uniref:Conserved oligomeric Golgi complex subunit 1 n=1 Tax=Rotaria magnacalcarata TaxID=392030 RepID=A0A8S2LXD4_9BILA|nr:unnamed protein product [Rotaria magnacalcarata]